MRNLKLNSVEAEGKGRYYQSPNTLRWYPSVTTVVNHEMEDYWREWRKKPENLAVSKKALARGTRLHSVVEEYLIDEIIPTDPFDKMKFDLLLPYLNKIGKIHAVETPLFSDQILMAGRVDCIGEYGGELSIIDFKTAGKAKTKDQIQNYFHQTAAYSHMWNEFSEEKNKVKRIVILIVNDDGEVQEFIEDPSDHKKSLFSVIRSYWDKYSFKEVQETANGIFQQTLRA
jgi:ATP-dependent exoDNAse (exonuclease V) beta subunit